MKPDLVEPGPTVVHRLLTAFVGWVCNYPKLVLTAALLLAGLSVGLACTRLQYRTQRNDLMSSTKECQQRWRQYLDEFGNDDDMVVVVRGGDRLRMTAALEDLAGRIQQRPDLFDRLFYKVDLRPLGSRALLFLNGDEIQQICDGLEPMRPLLQLGPGAWQSFTLQSLVQVAQLKASLLKPGQPLSTGDQQFFAQLLAICRAADSALAGNYQSPWSSLMPRPSGQQEMLTQPQFFLSGDGELAFLLVRPVQVEGSFTAARSSVEGLRSLIGEGRGAFPDLEFGLTGLPVLENDEMVASQHDTELASWLALAAVAVLYFLVFRGYYYPMLTVGTLLIGIAWAMGWMTLTIGYLNILSATFAVMLIAMGDYGVLWVTRYEQARRAGMAVRAALLHTATHVAVGNLTAASALALAFFAAIMADFQAVAELGWIAGCGVLLCALACFTVLPSVLTLADRRPQPLAAADPQAVQVPWLPTITRRPRLVIGLAMALTVVLAFLATRVRYDHNLLNLQDPNQEAVRWEHALIDHTQGASWHALSYTNTPEEALALKAHYERLPEVSLVVEVASLVPRDQERKLPLLRNIQRLLDNLPPRGATIAHDRPRSTEVQTALVGLERRLQLLTRSGGPQLLVDLRTSLKGLHARLRSLPEADVAGLKLQSFEERITGDLAENLHCLRGVSEPKAINLDDLPPALRERYLSRNGKWLLRVFAKDCLWDFGPLEHFTQRVRTVDPEATGKPFSTVEGLKALKNGFLWAGFYALTVIILVLLADFRSLRYALVALAPLVMGLLLSLGVIGLAGLPLNPANMIALPLILGVGIDNGVHVLHDYLLRRGTGPSTISRAIGRGVLVKALTTMIGFGALMVSNHRGLFGLGLLLTLGVGCCMLTALVFLPALLRALGGQPQQEIEKENIPERLRAA